MMTEPHNLGRAAGWSGEARRRLAALAAALTRGEANEALEAVETPVEWILAGMFHHRARNVIPTRLYGNVRAARVPDRFGCACGEPRRSHRPGDSTEIAEGAGTARCSSIVSTCTGVALAPYARRAYTFL
ncbi:MAG: hypothetical protein JWN04_963 [Myxococcaceae bacterium]|nr:hypothetical protein [Myxococcaceae bacterium]